MSSYSTGNLKYYCYFPNECDKNKPFRSFPAIVSKNRNNKFIALGKGEKLNFKSFSESKQIDNSTDESMYDKWKRISVSGKHDDILSFLSSEECHLEKMKQMGHISRMYYLFNKQDSMKFWQKLIIYDDIIWSFDLKILFQFLSQQKYFRKQQLSPYFYISPDLCFKNNKIPCFEYYPLSV